MKRTTGNVRAVDLARDSGAAIALMLPHVIAYNASVPSKFMPSPNQRGYVAHKKYATIADLLGLGGSNIEEKVERLSGDVERLTAKKVGASAVFTGTLAMFAAAGFREVGRTFPSRPVMRLDL